MASKSETGMVRNIASFNELIAFCTGLKTAYKPKRVDLQVPQLSNLLNSTNGSVDVWAKSKAKYQKAVDLCEKAFKKLKPFASQLIKALKASGADKEVIETALTWQRKFHNRKPKDKKKTDDTATNPEDKKKKKISVSHQSREKLMEVFTGLIAVLESEPLYDPNEVELQVSTQQALLNELKASHDAVMSSRVDERSLRMTRDRWLYVQKTGMIDIATAVKLYVQSKYKPTTPEYESVTKIKFTKFKTLKE